MARVVLTPEALEDLAQMSTWLEERAPGFGERFARAVEERLALLATHPELGPGYRRRWRRLLIHEFHQGAFFIGCAGKLWRCSPSWTSGATRATLRAR